MLGIQPRLQLGFKPTPTQRTFAEFSNSGIYQEVEK
jgi:hypothetical protein